MTFVPFSWYTEMLLSSNPVFPIFSQLGHSLACGAGKRKRICFFFVHTAERVFLLPRRALSGLTGDSRWKPESAAAQRSPNKENEVFFLRWSRTSTTARPSARALPAMKKSWTCPTSWRCRRTPISGSWTRDCGRSSRMWPRSPTTRATWSSPSSTTPWMSPQVQRGGVQGPGRHVRRAHQGAGAPAQQGDRGDQGAGDLHGRLPPDDQGRHLRHQRRRARIVSQIVRSPGIYYSHTEDKAGGITYATTVIPYRGAWLEYETDLNDAFYVRIDKNPSCPSPA